VTEHLNGFLAFLTSKVGGIIGFLTGLFTVTTANSTIPVDVMQYVVFSIGPVQFPTQSLLTIIGAITTSVFFLAQMYVIAKGKKAEIDMAERQEKIVHDMQELQEIIGIRDEERQ